MPRSAHVVGAGPVGCLAALSLAKQGWQVHIYEARPESFFTADADIRARRSINLAISARGITALRAIDPAMTSRVLDNMIPMKGRYVHDRSGSHSKQLYDTAGQCINSVDRGLLNRILLKEAIGHPSIQISFQHKLIAANFDKKSLILEVISPNGGNITKEVFFDLCVGTDGSYSNVRRQLMRVVRMDFQQEYIPHDYLELHIPPVTDIHGDSGFALDPDYLHIWPRHSFLLIALPNKDKTFTCTLFAPIQILNQLSNYQSVSAWFRDHFPDLIPYIGIERLVNDFQKNPRSSLIWIKAKPYHYKDRVVILGDAAHSMVPFYGQGLNCGFEDVRVLNSILQTHCVNPLAYVKGDQDSNLSAALEEYSAGRHDDLVAICDLALENYVELRHSVTTPLYHLQRFVDKYFSKLTSHSSAEKVTNGDQQRAFPSQWAGGWLPLYTMVTFRADMSYSRARKQAYVQATLLKAVSCGIVLSAIRIGLKHILGAKVPWKGIGNE